MSNTDKLEILKIDGNEAVSKLLELRKEFADSGKYPFIIGNAENFQTPSAYANFRSPSSDEILKKSELIDASEWFAEMKSGFDKIKEDYDEEFEPDEVIGEYIKPESSPRDLGLYFDDRIFAHQDILKRIPYGKVLIGLAEIKESWMLPAKVRFGGWNACPNPEIHCAVMKKWQDRYAAEIVSMTNDTIECKVGNPPNSDEEVMNLAWEQYLYCNDLVDQGVGSISDLALLIYDSDYWYFWWD